MQEQEVGMVGGWADEAERSLRDSDPLGPVTAFVVRSARLSPARPVQDQHALDPLAVPFELPTQVGLADAASQGGTLHAPGPGGALPSGNVHPAPLQPPGLR
eukprot:g15111.t1